MNTFFIKAKHYNKGLHIGYMAKIKACTFSDFNSISERVVITGVNIGFASYISRNARLKDVKIGKYCSIGPNVLINQGEHPTAGFVSTHPAFYSSRKQSGFSFTQKNLFEEFKQVIIGNDVWIGANAIIRSGITIGDGAIVAAGAVVTRDIEPYAIVGGVPAKLLKYRFNLEGRSKLLKSKWWDWDLEKLKRESQNFLELGEFISELTPNDFVLNN